jgi:hypothetical protein
MWRFLHVSRAVGIVGVSVPEAIDPASNVDNLAAGK